MPRTDGYQPIDSTTGSAFVWLVKEIPIPKNQDNPLRFSFYYLFTDITYKFEYRSSSHLVQTAWPQVRFSFSLYLYKQKEKNTPLINF